MKKSLFVFMMLVSTSSLAASSFTDELSTAWKQQQSKHALIDRNDMTMGYGGADISAKAPVMLASVIA